MATSTSNEGTPRGGSPGVDPKEGERNDWASYTPEERAEADTSGVDGTQFLTEAYGVDEAGLNSSTDEPVGADESGS